jgi:hypothetical protein
MKAKCFTSIGKSTNVDCEVTDSGVRALLLVIGVAYAAPQLSGYDLSFLKNPLMEFAGVLFFHAIERPVSIAMEIVNHLLELYTEIVSVSVV